MTPQALVRDALEVITFPAAAAKVLELLEDPDVRPGQIADALALDPPLASRVLRIANSPFFLGQSPVDELRRAVMVLGTALLRDLVLGAAAVKAFQSIDVPAAELEAYWQHSICCGSLAAEIALVNSRRLAEVAFTAGLMHDLGELVLLIRCPEEMQAIRTSFGEEPDGRALCDAEAAQFGFDHAAVGSALGSAWHFPATLVDCMAFHHAPADAHHDFGELVAIVHIANGCAALFDAPASEVPPSIEPATWAAAGIDATMLPEILERARERVESMQAALL